MINALNRVGDADDANAIKLTPSASPEECGPVFTNWFNFGNDPIQIRRAILAMPASDFREGYTVVTAKANDGYVNHYWQGFPVVALSALVVDGRKEIESGLVELAKYQRFPLANPGDKKDDLSMQEILAARTALEKIRGARTTATAPLPAGGVGQPAKPIGQGGITQNKDVDAQLELLRGTNLLRDKQDYFDKLDRFFVALPADNKPLSVSFTVNKEKIKDENYIVYRFQTMMISQNGKGP